MALLEPEEQARIQGLVINKFRGDKAILDPGLTMLEELTGKKVVGVVPYLPLDLDDEDSLTDRFQRPAQRGLVDIAVIRLPRISNFTDFNPLACLEQVSLRYVDCVASLGQPHVIILPGTKNTMEDLKWLRESGLEAAICRHASRGGAVMGICGGYQMLGSRLSDPEGVEAGGQMRGMGLLEAETVFQGEKTRTRVRGRVLQARESLSPWRERPLQAMKFIWAGPRRPCRPLQSWREAKAAGMAVRRECVWDLWSTAFLTKGRSVGPL